MMKLGGYVHCTKISPEFEFWVKGQGHQGQKTRLAMPTPRVRTNGMRWLSVAAMVFSGACMRCVFGESFLALLSK